MRRLAGLVCFLVLLTACGSPVGDGLPQATVTPTSIAAAAIDATANATATRVTPEASAPATATRTTPAAGTPATAVSPRPGAPATPGTPGTPGVPIRATPTGGPTVIQLFAPYRPTGLASDLRVADNLNGYCLAGSEVLRGRPDAWRCASGNRVLDPCLEAGTADPTPLACATAPWSDDVALLTLTAPLPRDRANAAGGMTGHPWAFQLANGARCQLAGGAAATVAGLRINTTCSDGTHTLGDPDRSGTRWRIFVMHDNSPSLELEEIAIVWY